MENTKIGKGYCSEDCDCDICEDNYRSKLNDINCVEDSE